MYIARKHIGPYEDLLQRQTHENLNVMVREPAKASDDEAGRRRNGLTTSWSGPANPSQTRAMAQPAGVERADEEVCHDAPPRFLTGLRDQERQKGCNHVLMYTDE